MDDNLRALTEQLTTASKRTYMSRIQTGSGGNVSARVPGKDLMLVKASGSSLYDSTPEGFVICNFDGVKISGEGEPTREAFLHGLIYKMCPTANAVVHTHSPYSIAWASTLKPLTRTTWHSQLKMNSDLPVLNIPSPMVKPEYAYMVEEVLKENPTITGFLLVDHGIVAIGKNPMNAEQNAELIEETAEVSILKDLVKKLVQ